ncbi:hypothetical protein T492DRAFT_1045193 [Pavlovales sp. CCMP2436]|nr:hypothetical protein T492DRAFT_1045193 [Pavlovales sp. CCMP2436]
MLAWCQGVGARTELSAGSGDIRPRPLPKMSSSSAGDELSSWRALPSSRR